MTILGFPLKCTQGTSDSSSEHPALANVPPSDPSPEGSLFHGSFWHTVDRASGRQCWGVTLCSSLLGLGFKVQTPISEKSWMYKSEHLSSLCILSASCYAPFRSFKCNQFDVIPTETINCPLGSLGN